MSIALATGLTSQGIDVTTVAMEDMRHRPDDEQLMFAVSQGRALFSYNVADFQRLHSLYMRLGRHHAGVILVRQRRYDVGETIRRLARISASFEPEQMVDRLEFLNAWE